MLNISLIVWAILILCIFIEYKALTKYKKLNESNKSFLAGITHDLKNPTFAQINILNLLLKGNFGELNPEQYEMIKLTRSSSKYMSNLVGNILTDYEYDSKSIKLNFSDFDIIELINIICAENKSLYCDKNQKLTFDHKNMNRCIIRADKLQIERVIHNLLSNAITYGFCNSKIKLSLKVYKNTLRFTIRNYSNPVDNQNFKSIFKKFTRTKNSIFNKNSTGLGLYVTKKIINLHKGRIIAHCNARGIYTFGFYLKNNLCNIEEKNILERKQELL